MEEECEYAFFQQDGATAYTFREKRSISTGLWSPRSPDLSICDFYLWGNLKGKVYSNSPHVGQVAQAARRLATGWTARVRSGCRRGGDFSSLLRVQTGPGVHSTSYKVSTGEFPRG